MLFLSGFFTHPAPFPSRHLPFPPLRVVAVNQNTFTRFLGHAMAAASSSSSASSLNLSPAAALSLKGSRRRLLEKEPSTTAVLAAGAGNRGGGNGAGGGNGGDLFWPYVTRAAEILTTFSKSDSVVKEGVAEDQCLQGARAGGPPGRGVGEGGREEEKGAGSCLLFAVLVSVDGLT